MRGLKSVATGRRKETSRRVQPKAEDKLNKHFMILSFGKADHEALYSELEGTAKSA